MMRIVSQTLKYASLLSVSTMLLSGCVSLDIDEALGKTSNTLEGFTGAELILKRTWTDNEHANTIVNELLDEPLTQSDAIQLALANSPTFQAILANNWPTTGQVRRNRPRLDKLPIRCWLSSA